jgi:hypothetical protein
LRKQKAIVFGQFTGIRKVPGYDRGFRPGHGGRPAAQRH